jgi:hypothetical protein
LFSCLFSFSSLSHFPLATPRPPPHSSPQTYKIRTY